MIITICGKWRSSSGKEFTLETLMQHEKDCKNCKKIMNGDPTFEKTDLIADDDMPDGAYFAMAWEMGEL